MFSSRTQWLHQPNRITKLLDELRSRGSAIYDLTNTNPTDVDIAYPDKDILAALSDSRSVCYEPDPRGLISAREVVAEYYRSKQVDVVPSNVLLTASTSEAYAYAFMMLCDAGDNVLVPTPSYPLFEFLAQLNHVQIGTYQLRYDGEWHIDIESVRKGITPSTRAIVIVSPHNPTGMFMKRREHEALTAIANEHHLALIVDEVFAEYAFTTDPCRVLTTAGSRDALTLTLNGISKLCGLPQMKLGWMVVSGGEEEKTEALQRLEIIADTFLSVNTPVQSGLPELMKCGQIIRRQIQERVQQNLAYLHASVPGRSPITVMNCEGGWHVVVRIPNTKSEEEWVRMLLEHAHVCVFPGYYFEFREEGYLVLSLLTLPETFTRGVKGIIEIVTA